MEKQTIQTSAAPAAIGPYSQGIIAGDMVFVSGQLPVIPDTGIIPEGIRAQTEQSICNLNEILKQAGTDLQHVVKTAVFLSSMEDFAAMNEIYTGFFGTGGYPARSAFEVSRLPKDALVEVEAIAVR